MRLKCERCGHRWKTRTEKKPSVCPRCKNKKWETLKETDECKHGRLYVVLMEDDIIKVGQTTAEHRRIAQYQDVVGYSFSGMFYNLNKEERALIKFTKTVCGEVAAGQEYFNGDIQAFNKISAYIKALGPYESFSGKNDYDYNKLACMCAIERSLPFVRNIEAARLAERTQFYLATQEAFNDFIHGKCDANTAFVSLLDISLNMKQLSEDVLGDISVAGLSEKFDVDINEICSGDV